MTQIAESAVRFGTGSDFGFHKPSRFFDLPSSRSESRLGRLGIRSVGVGVRSGHQKTGQDSQSMWVAFLDGKVVRAGLGNVKNAEYEGYQWYVNTPPAKAGGFGLRLKAGSIGRSAD